MTVDNDGPDYDDYEYLDEDDCTLCGGEGYDECNDPIQCMRRHAGTGPYALCPCAGCGGTGRARDQVIW